MDAVAQELKGSTLSRIAALDRILSIIRETPELVDEIADNYGACIVNMDRESDACFEKMILVVTELVRMTSFNLKHIVAKKLIPGLIRGFDINSDHTNMALLELLGVLGISEQSEPLIECLFKSTNTEIVNRSLMLVKEHRYHLSSFSVLQLLGHKASRIRLAAISAVDQCLMRAEPWRKTYPTIAAMAALTTDVVPIADFFNPPTRVNYMSRLTFDSNLVVRRAWFSQLVDWVTTLEDRADVDAHLCPYLLTGLFDEDVKVQVLQWMNERLGSNDDLGVDGISQTAKSWVRTHARHFIEAFLHNIDADFLNCSSLNALRMLNVVISFLGEHALEWLPRIFAIVARCDRDMGNRILSSVSRYVHCEEIWKILVLFDPQDEEVWWWMTRALLASPPLSISLELSSALGKLQRPNEHARHIFGQLVSTGAKNADLAWAGLALRDPRLDELFMDSMVQIYDRLRATSNIRTRDNLISFLETLVRVKVKFHPVMDFIRERQFIDGEVLGLVFKVDPESAINLSLDFRQLEATSFLQSIIVCTSTAENLINLIVEGICLLPDSPGPTEWECLCVAAERGHVQPRLTPDIDDDTDPVWVSKVRYLELTDQLSIIALDAITKKVVDVDWPFVQQVLRKLFEAHPREYLERITELNGAGYISRSLYLEELIFCYFF
jgi:hypothetical protein